MARLCLWVFGDAMSLTTSNIFAALDQTKKKKKSGKEGKDKTDKKKATSKAAKAEEAEQRNAQLEAAIFSQQNTARYQLGRRRRGRR